MPQDTTVTFYEDGQYVTISGPKDSIESLHRQYEENKPVVMEMYPPANSTQPADNSIITPLLFIGVMVAVMYWLEIKAAPWIRRKLGIFLYGAQDDPASTSFVHGQRNLKYEGSSLQFSDAEMVKVLNKYFPYYTKLGYDDKLRFFERLTKFIRAKTFVIHDESGFKEMPILISAAAVQLSFGLDKYLLPYFPNIHIFPEEFIGHHPTIRLLEGNVSNHCINLSWKHFLNGYQMPDNGQNVGLHEFAHAYYYQYFVAKQNIEKDFVETFPLFDMHANKAFEAEKLPGSDLYSDYALTDFQEFWAESIEIFFEKPAALKEKYLELYTAVCSILNQDPLNYQGGIA